VRLYLAALAAILAACLLAATAQARVRVIPRVCSTKTSPARVFCAIHHHRRAANRLRAGMGLRPIPYLWIAERHTTSDARRLRILGYWRHVHAHAVRQWHSYAPWTPGWHADAMCVHGYEGSWTVDHGIGPRVSGGMQIGDSEWAHFGGLAFAPRAYLATAHEQLLVAWRYWRVSGWYPWPSTARMCGLI
jgi:hypothetical protein